MHSPKQYIAHLKELVSQNKLAEAIANLQDLFQGSQALNEVILQSSRFNQLKESIRTGTIRLEDANIERNKLTLALLEIIDEFTAELDTHPTLSQEVGDLIQGDQNVIIKNVTDSTITINYGGETTEIDRKLDELLKLLKSQATEEIKAGQKTYRLDHLTSDKFDFIIDQARIDKSLPDDHSEDLLQITDRNRWVQSLKQDLLKQGVDVRNSPSEIINYYGWLIETYLQKMLTPPGQAGDLRALSFMTEAWFSSLRYVCFIQLAQIFRHARETDEAVIDAKLQQYLSLDGQNPSSASAGETKYDYLDQLTTLVEAPQKQFVPELQDFIEDLLDTETDLYATMRFLEHHRNRLLAGVIHDSELPQLIPQYLTGLTYWLRKLAFLAKYRLLSIKDINLSYRLGTAINFVHLYGELHGMYNESFSDSGDYNEFVVDQYFTYNHSVLLFKGTSVRESLRSFTAENLPLSLSPLLIDQSVFANKETQTPEIFYYIGQSKKGRRYHYAQYKNELPIEAKKELASNKTLDVKAENDKQPKLNELYEQLKTVFQPFKAAAR